MGKHIWAQQLVLVLRSISRGIDWKIWAIRCCKNMHGSLEQIHDKPEKMDAEHWLANFVEQQLGHFEAHLMFTSLKYGQLSSGTKTYFNITQIMLAFQISSSWMIQGYHQTNIKHQYFQTSNIIEYTNTKVLSCWTLVKQTSNNIGFLFHKMCWAPAFALSWCAQSGDNWPHSGHGELWVPSWFLWDREMIMAFMVGFPYLYYSLLFYIHETWRVWVFSWFWAFRFSTTNPR